MADINQGPNGNPERGEMIIPKNVMELYMQLKGEGWEQVAESNSTSDESEQNTGRKRKPAATVEVSHLVLEKPSASETRKVRITVRFIGDEVHCTIFTFPYNTQLSKLITIPEKNLHLLRQMIQDHWEFINLVEKAEAVPAQEGKKTPDKVKAAMREKFKRTDVFERKGDKLVRVSES